MDKRGREGSVVPVHDEVKGGKEGIRFVLPAEDFVGDDSTPEGVERGNRKDGVSSFGPKVEIVERKLSVEELGLVFDSGTIHTLVGSHIRSMIPSRSACATAVWLVAAELLDEPYMPARRV